jgi:hypothetical protein
VSGTSKGAEPKLIGCARGSLRELLNDYQDILRVRQSPLWTKNSREALFVRKIGGNRDATYEADRNFCETRPIEVVANIAICLIYQTNYLTRPATPPTSARFRKRRPTARTDVPRASTAARPVIPRFHLRRGLVAEVPAP